MINLNAFGNCATDVAGTGTGQCPIDQLGDMLGIGLLNKGTTLDVVTDSLNETNFRTLITSGKLHQLLDREAFEQNTPDNDMYTSPEGLITSIRAGKPQFALTYSKGLCFHKALYDLQGKNRWDAILYFEKGMLMATNVSNTKVKGFDAGSLIVGTYMFQQGTEIEKGKATIQFKSAEEFNTKWVYFSYDQLGYSPLDIDGVIDTKLSFVETPQVAATYVKVKVLDSCNTSINYATLFDSVSDYTLKVGGFPRTISAVSVNSGEVSLSFATALTLGQSIEVSLNGILADADLNYYKSAILKAVTIA
jgi:hypothetical protein